MTLPRRWRQKENSRDERAAPQHGEARRQRQVNADVAFQSGIQHGRQHEGGRYREPQMPDDARRSSLSFLM